MPAIKFKKLHPDAKVPAKADEGAACFDLFAVEDFAVTCMPQLVKTGLAVEIPPGWEMQIRPRSGLALKRGIVVLNSPGTIDSSYRGEVGVIMYQVPTHWAEKVSLPRSMHFIKGDKIAQCLISHVPQVEWVEAEELSQTERGEGGFGSSGR